MPQRATAPVGRAASRGSVWVSTCLTEPRPKGSGPGARSLREVLAFGFQNAALALRAPAVTAIAAVFAHHAVAWDRESDGIGRAGAGYGADGGGASDGGSHFGVRFGGASRDGAEVLPDQALKGGRADVEREIDAFAAPGEVLGELRRPCGYGAIIALDDVA